MVDGGKELITYVGMLVSEPTATNKILTQLRQYKGKQAGSLPQMSQENSRGAPQVYTRNTNGMLLQPAPQVLDLKPTKDGKQHHKMTWDVSAVTG
eukprot:1159907-Pelagomonas_calceolata.AAC.2